MSSAYIQGPVYDPEMTSFCNIRSDFLEQRCFTLGEKGIPQHLSIMLCLLLQVKWHVSEGKKSDITYDLFLKNLLC